METRRDAFQAIADPTRRAILGLLAVQTLTLNALAGNFEISRPAISKHVKVLSECGLVEIKQQGRERYCEAKLEKLNEVSVWIEQYRQYWESKFDALELYLETLQKDKKHAKKRK
jgi:DNA-binding transcriptional ArsR family regulator